jgi:hypothetical protein
MRRIDGEDDESRGEHVTKMATQPRGGDQCRTLTVAKRTLSYFEGVWLLRILKVT